MTRAIRLGLLTSVWAASQAAAASPEGVRVTAAPVDGSSALWQGWDPEEDHQAMFVADGDKKTGWVEGADGDGAGEWIRLHVEPVAAVARVEVAVANGCQQSGASYRRYGRVKQATVTLQPGGASAVMALADDKDWQTQVIEQPAGPLTAVELRIDAVYPGSGGENTCLSEVAVHLPAAAAVDTAGEKARAAALREWVKARRALGKTFGRKKAKDPLPFAPRYVVRPDGGETALDCGTDQVCFIEEGLRALQRGLGDKAPAEIDRALAQMKETSGWAPVAVKVGDTRPVPPIDGLCSHEGLDGWPCTQGVELPAALGWLEAAQVQTTPVELIPSMRQLG
ncbi:MAG: hypothetical protein H6701_14005, partial [Myxococcales bacterium]|nr:hypothetical protein [Myxococcales bacterium]